MLDVEVLWIDVVCVRRRGSSEGCGTQTSGALAAFDFVKIDVKDPNVGLCTSSHSESAKR